MDGTDHVLRGPAERAQEQERERCPDNVFAFHFFSLLGDLIGISFLARKQANAYGGFALE
jgi:hypothetical protein